MADLTQVQLPNGVTYDIKDSTKLPLAGGTMTGSLNMAGSDISLDTSSSSSDDSGDIVWKYGNGQEKARLWTNNEYSSAVGLNYRIYKKDGTNVYDGTIPLTDTNTTYTFANGTNGFTVTPSGGSAQTVTVTPNDTTKVAKAGDTMTGNLTVTDVLGINQSTGTSGGISLYGGSGYVGDYGIAFRTTSNMGKHGYVQGDWATYFTMDGVNRGWVYRYNSNSDVASISVDGNAVFNGSVTVGGNAANTSGARMQFNSTTQAIDFVFV